MTRDSEPTSAAMSEEQRAAIFAGALAPTGRDGRPRIGRGAIPSKFVLVVAATFVILGLGGVLVEHYFGGVGLTSSRSLPTLPSTPIGPTGPQLGATTRAFMGLRDIANAKAPPFTLRDQLNRPWSLAEHRGEVVVLTFFNRDCTDICPVVGAEIRFARLGLGAVASKVVFAIVNSDPRQPGVGPRPAALTSTGLVTSRSTYFLSGPLRQLTAVWVGYGLSVKVGALRSQVAHNNVMYFIAPNGRLAALAVPFGNEDRSGRFSLNAVEVHRFARGIATVAVSLAR